MERAESHPDDSTEAPWLAAWLADLATYVAELRPNCPTERLLIIAVMRQAWLDDEAQRRQGLPAGDPTPAQRLNQLISEPERAAAWRSLAERRREMQLPYEDRKALLQQRAIEVELERERAARHRDPAAKGQNEAELDSSTAPPGELPANRSFTSPIKAREAFYAIPGNRELGQRKAYQKYLNEGWQPKQSRNSFTPKVRGRPKNAH